MAERDREQPKVEGEFRKRFCLGRSGELLGSFDTVEELISERDADRNLRREIYGNETYTYREDGKEIFAARMNQLLKDEQNKK